MLICRGFFGGVLFLTPPSFLCFLWYWSQPFGLSLPHYLLPVDQAFLLHVINLCWLYFPHTELLLLCWPLLIKAWVELSAWLLGWGITLSLCFMALTYCCPDLRPGQAFLWDQGPRVQGGNLQWFPVTALLSVMPILQDHPFYHWHPAYEQWILGRLSCSYGSLLTLGACWASASDSEEGQPHHHGDG